VKDCSLGVNQESELEGAGRKCRRSGGAWEIAGMTRDQRRLQGDRTDPFGRVVDCCATGGKTWVPVDFNNGTSAKAFPCTSG